MSHLVALPWRFFDNGQPCIPRLLPDGSIAWYEIDRGAGTRDRYLGDAPTARRMKLSTDFAVYNFSFYCEDGSVPHASSQQRLYCEPDGSEEMLRIVEAPYRARLLTRERREKTTQEILRDIEHWLEHIKGAEIRAVAERLQREARPVAHLARQLDRTAELEAGLPDQLAAGAAPPLLENDS